MYVVGVEASGEIREAAEWACVLLSRPNRVVSRARFKKGNIGNIVVCSTHG